MKISIIIPVYNVAPYVEQCIKSVLNQDYENIEIIIVDDCSTDNSMELVRGMISETSRTVYILTHQYNRGAAAARNTGIMRATGEYIYFIDSDDYIEPDCISSLVKMAQIYPKAEIIIGSIKSISSINLNILYKAYLKEYYENSNEIKKIMLNSNKFPNSVCNELIKREWILKNNLFFKEGIIFEDTHWIFYAAKYTKRMVFYKKTTYHYRSNQDGVMMSCQERKTASINIIIKDWVSHLDRQCLFAQLYAVFHLAHTCYVIQYGGGKRPSYIRIFYPLYILSKLYLVKK